MLSHHTILTQSGKQNRYGITRFAASRNNKRDVMNNEISGPFAGDKFMNIKSIIH
jgi:hypothetical protein